MESHSDGKADTYNNQRNYHSNNDQHHHHNNNPNSITSTNNNYRNDNTLGYNKLNSSLPKNLNTTSIPIRNGYANYSHGKLLMMIVINYLKNKSFQIFSC